MATYKEFLQNQGEKKWQGKWLEEKIDRADDFDKRPKKYILDMFPYPSGAGLHVGHPEGYTATDIYSRYWRLRGYNVLHPMGWDAFGLPAENYAIKTGTHPRVTTEQNIATFKRQIQSLGFSYDWDREIDTTDPKYYQWTQWIFLQLFKKGLAYEATVPINFCPSCKTGLANEEVKDGKCDRCGAEVERKNMRQWMLRITAYADRLLSGLDKLDWPESIKSLQRNWIGRSEGADVDFKIKCRDVACNVSTNAITVYTTRPDTLFGATYMVLSPEHKLVQELKNQIANWAEVEAYINIAKNKSDLERTELNKEKTGVELKGIKAINPVNNAEIPIWISDYVLASYGTGAIMAVPAHDTRDWEFAKKFALPIIDVIRPVEGEKHDDEQSRRTISAVVQRKSDNKFLLVKWKQFDWFSPVIGGIDGDETPEQAAEREVLEETGYKVRAVEKLGGEIESHFFAENKNVWRERFDQPVLLELIDENPEELNDEESARHEAVWLNGDEAIKKITHSYNAVGLQRYLAKNYAYTDVDEGVMINSEFLNGLVPAEAIGKMTSWLTEKGYGKKAINYKLRDWVFSRQRYWGEPIPLVHCESCKEKVMNNSATINFREQETWGRLVAGQKTVETRVLNPEEVDRYFGNIKKGNTIKAINKITGQEKYFEVADVWQYKDLKELFKDKEVLAQVYAPKPLPESIEEMEQGYSYTPDYLERINKNGLIAWKVKMITPGIVPVPEKDLPLVLPEVEKYEPTGTGESPLVAIDKWVNTTCPQCGGPAKRETNTMPQWAGSSWYWLRFIDPKNDKELADQKKLKYWLPVDLYLGGAEHAVLHLLYARFWNMALYDIGAVPFEEPFAKLVNQGLILGEDGEKMSKSRGNVINPDDILSVHGADAFRMYEMFMGPLEQMKPWSTQGMIGIDRMLEKAWNLSIEIKGDIVGEDAIEGDIRQCRLRDSVAAEVLLNKTIKKVGEDIEKMSFNTAISAMMILLNKFQEDKNISNDVWKKFLLILSPFAPHLTEELWLKLGNKKSIFKESWPQYDEAKIKDEQIELPVQINGKIRGKVTVVADADEKTVSELAQADENVAKYLVGQTIKKTIYVKGKLISFVI